MNLDLRGRLRGLRLRSRLMLLAGLGSLPAVPLAAELYGGGLGRSRALGLAALLLAGALGLAWAASGRLLHPLRSLQAALRRAVEEGDLTQSADVQGQDELGELAGQFNGLLELLRQVYVNLGRSMEQLSSSLAVIREEAQLQAESAARQAANLQQTQVTAEEIRQLCGRTDARASQVLESTAKASRLGEDGRQALGRGQTELSAIGQQVRQMRDQVASLPPQMRHIESVLDTVKGLADQSNMLALNASIEAVRSGEHGKGFGLVAREIRKLADASIHSTERIRETLDALRLAVGQTDKLAENGARQVESGLETVQKSSGTLGQLTGMVQSDAEAAHQIAEAVRQQTLGVEQIFQALKDQEHLMAETRRQADALAQAVAPLDGLAARIQRQVQRFVV
jgi:methyl-accepting chemotaxis protein